MKLKVTILVGIILIYTFVLQIVLGLKVDKKSTNILPQPIILKVQKRDKSSFLYILRNGNAKKSQGIDKQKQEIVNVDPRIFSSYTDEKKNQINLKLKSNSKITLKNQHGKMVQDTNYLKLLSVIADTLHHDIYKIRLFKIKKQYYVFVEFNAGLIDGGTLYYFNTKTKQLKQVIEIEKGEIMRLELLQDGILK